jgi:hypothetical protein
MINFAQLRNICFYTIIVNDLPGVVAHSHLPDFSLEGKNT